MSQMYIPPKMTKTGMYKTVMNVTLTPQQITSHSTEENVSNKTNEKILTVRMF